MTETKSLILDKAKFSDWKEMYHHVWPRPESAKHMAWGITTSEENVQIRVRKNIEFQKDHATYLIYEEARGKSIGPAGIEKLSPYVYQEAGTCLEPDYAGKGLGKQVLQGLIQHCRRKFGAKKFIYSRREENEASK